MHVAASGMASQRKRMDAVASNIANAQVTNVDGNGNPYLRKQVVMGTVPDRLFVTALKKQMKLNVSRSSDAHLLPDNTIDRRREIPPLVEGNEIEIANIGKNIQYDPTHPDADENGYVTYPDVNILEEMTELMHASRSYEANVTVINASKQMIMKALDI